MSDAARHDVVHPVSLRAGPLRATVYPQFGMTAGSLRRSPGPELLSRVAPMAPRPTDLGAQGEASGESLARLLFGGWFEMNPNAGFPTGELGRRTYFHGEAVRRSWTVLDAGPDFVEATIDARSAPFTMVRRFDLTEVGLVARTEILNRGEEGLAISPGEHPCFRRDVFAEGRIEITGTWVDERRFEPTVPRQADGSSGNAMLRDATSIRLVDASGRSILVRVDTTAHDRVGLWWNFARGGDRPAGPTGWDCIAVEPHSTERLLEPGESFSSTTSVEVDAEWARP